MARRNAFARLAWGTLYAKIGLLGLAVVLAAVLYVRLSAGPVSLQWLGGKVAGALAERIGPDWTVTLGDAALVLEDGSLALRAASLTVRNPKGVTVVRAPYAVVGVETLPLLTGNLQPRSIELRDLQLQAAMNPDGSLSFQAMGEGGSAELSTTMFASRDEDDPGQPGGQGEVPPPSPVSAALSSLFELIVDPTNVVGALDRARVTNARLTLIDADQRKRVAFSRVDADFAHAASRTRRFEMKLEGVYGPWRIGGEVFRGRGARRNGTIMLTDVPVHDLLLLSGLSGLPAWSDLKLSGRAEASLVRGTLDRLEARFETGRGIVQIEDKDTSPIFVDKASATASWDEAQRRFALENVHFKGGETELTLRGELTTVAGEPGWRLALNGKDALISGASATDLPFKVDTVEALVSSSGRRLNFDRLALRTDKFSVVVNGSYGSAEGDGLRATVDARQIDVRTTLRLWPEGMASAVRRFLVANLRSGTVESLKLRAALSAEELSRALVGGPVPEKAVTVDFAMRDAELAVSEGLPTIWQGYVEGRVTGANASIRGPKGHIQMADGRALALSDGTFKVADMRPQHAVAQTAFRISGGADALTSLLQEPMLRSIIGFELDPENVKGRADLKIDLALPLDEVPATPDLPVTVTGTVNDLVVEKAFGRDKLEGANLALTYGRGSLNLRGEGRLGGTPAVLDLRQAPGEPGELAVLVTLDEAARARRGFSVGSQLTGPVALRIGIPVGTVDPISPRIEIDLTKAAVDNLIPGWSKPAGKHGRVSFVLHEGNPADIRDLLIDSGTVQIRGTASLGPDGILDKADITSLKFSQGDDLRAQIERNAAVYRVMVRGNMLDARPFVKSFSSAPAPTTAAAQREKSEQREVEVDLAVNIVTGFNDEALTNTTLKVATRGRDLRQLQMDGRFRAARASAQLTRRERNPVVVIHSEDAGAMLRFVDLYKRMVGGQLTFQITAGDTPQAGNVIIDDFALRNEPALRRIISQQPVSTAADERGNITAPQVNPNEVHFTKLKADFVRTANHIDVREAVMWGVQVGFTLSGSIDYARDRTDISGTFVPAYGINNVFSQVPIVGLILGGGRNEGLIGVNFRISGPASSPTLTINPLSAVAPGFLRKFFGVGGSPADATATIPPAGIHSRPPR